MKSAFVVYIPEFSRDLVLCILANRSVQVERAEERSRVGRR